MKKFILKKVFYLYSIFLLFLSCLFPVSANEKILNLVSDIYIHSDSSAVISETVVFEGAEYGGNNLSIQFPKMYHDTNGKIFPIKYELLQSFKNFEISPQRIGIPGYQWADFIGRKGVVLSSDIYTYNVQYKIENIVQLSNGKMYFTWNVTKNYWQFPIMRAQVSVHLPANVVLGKLVGSADNISVTHPASDQLVYKTLKPLKPYANFNIDLNWSTGVPYKPSITEHTSGNRVALGLLIILLCYYLLIGIWELKNPEKDYIVTFIKSPLNLSPATIRVLFKKRFDIKAISATIISMAIKGYLTIQEDNNNEFTLIQNEKCTSPLSFGETIVASHLFNSDKITRLTKTYSEDLEEATLGLEKSTAIELESAYFLSHLMYFLPGLIVGIVAIFSLVQYSGNMLTGATVSLGFVSWSVCCYILFLTSMRKFIAYYNMKEKSSTPDYSFVLFAQVLLFLFFIAVLLVFVMLLADYISMSGAIILLFITLLNIIFYHVIKTYVLHNRLLLSKIIQFKKFLVRKDGLQSTTAKIQVIERYLPYALVLDAEKRWDEKLNAMHLSTNPKFDYPAWYIGRRLSTQDNASFAAHLSHDLSAAIAASILPITNTHGFGGGW